MKKIGEKLTWAGIGFLIATIPDFSKGPNVWVTPLIIGAGIFILGIIIYLYLKSCF